MEGVECGRHTMASTECKPIKGIWRQRFQQDPGAEPLVRGQVQSHREGEDIMLSGIQWKRLACLLVSLLIAEVGDHLVYLSLTNRKQSATVLFDQSWISSVHHWLGLPHLLDLPVHCTTFLRLR